MHRSCTLELHSIATGGQQGEVEAYPLHRGEAGAAVTQLGGGDQSMQRCRVNKTLENGEGGISDRCLNMFRGATAWGAHTAQEKMRKLI
jgi:hypothetical protein